MKHIAMGLLMIGVFAGSGCRRGVTVETWKNDWTIVTNDAEKNLSEPGYHSMGWIPGEVGPEFVNHPHDEGRGRRIGLMALHPISVTEPAKILFTGEIPMDAPILVVEASGNVHGDTLLQCVVNGKPIGEFVVDGSAWTTAEFDLSEYIYQPVRLELWNAAGGTKPWHFEHCYIDSISFKGKPAD